MTGDVAIALRILVVTALTAIQRPDGANVTFGYGGAGRLTTVSQPRGTNTLSYNSSTGTVASVTSPDTVTLTYSYLGPWVTKQEWVGRVAGTVEHAYSPELAVATQLVNGGPSISFSYDHDGLLTAAGALTGC